MAQAAEQRIWADGETEFSCEACPGFTPDGEADQFQCGIQAHSLSRVMSYDSRQPLAKDVLVTETVPAA